MSRRPSRASSQTVATRSSRDVEDEVHRRAETFVAARPPVPSVARGKTPSLARVTPATKLTALDSVRPLPGATRTWPGPAAPPRSR